MFVSGAAANVTSLFLFTPCDVIVQRAWVGYGAVEAGSRHPVRDAARATYAAQGLRGFWSGYSAVRPLCSPSPFLSRTQTDKLTHALLDSPWPPTHPVAPSGGACTPWHARGSRSRLRCHHGPERD